MMKWLGISIIFTLMLLPMGIFPLSTVDAQASEPVIIEHYEHTTTSILQPDGSSEVIHDYHYPYYFDGSDYVPYELSETPQVIQVIVDGGKFVFDKENSAVTVFNDDGIVINSDSYIVRNAEMGSDSWSALAVNDEPSTTSINEDGENLTITFTRENNEGIFSIDYLVRGPDMKATASFENAIYDNHKFAFTQTLEMGTNILDLNEQTINLDNYVGQSFDKTVLDENRDIVLAGQGLLYNSGLGFDRLWAVHIHEDNKISLDYASDPFNVETQTTIGETVELDPSMALGDLNNLACNAAKQHSHSGGGSTTFSKYCSYGTWGSARSYMWQWDSTAHNRYDVLCMIWNTSSVPTSATVTQIEFSGNQFAYGGYNVGDYGDCELYQMTGGHPGTSAATGQTASALHADIQSGLSYGTIPGNLSDPNTSDQIGCTGPSSSTYQLGGDTSLGHATNGFTGFTALAISDLNTAISTSAGFWQFGILKDTSANTGSIKGHWFDYPELRITYTVPVVPDVPTSLTATGNGVNVDLAWTVPASDGGSAITNYFYESSDDNFSTVHASGMTGSTSTSFTDSPSPVGTTYYYRVSAVNSVGTGSPSNIDSAFVGSPPDPPTSLTSVINNPDPSPLVIDLAWTTPSSMGSGTLTGYEVWRDSVLITTTSGAGTTYQDTVSSPGGTFVYEVKTVTNHGTSTASNQSSITTPTVPDPPTISLAINNPDPSPLDITITFTPPGNNGGSAITGYSLEHSTDDITYSTVAGGPFTTSTTHTVSAAGTQYYKATAINNVGSSALSSAQNIATPTITTPPQNLAATVLNDTSIDLTWDVPSSDGGSALVNYYVYRNSVNIQTVTSPLSFSDTGLTPNTTYTYQVYANNNVGMSASSNTITPTTYFAVSGSITTTQTVSGVSVLIDPTITTTGTPSPTFTEIKVYDNGVLHSTQAMGNTDCGAATDCVSYHFPTNDLTAHNVTLAVTDSSHWSTPTITSAIISVSPDYKANWDSNNVAFNVTRNTTDTILIVNRDTSIGWDLSCDLQTTAQAMAGTTGTHVRQVTSAWYFDTTSNPYPIGSGEHIYGECKEGTTTVLTFTSYGPNLIAGGINLFDSHMSDFLGLENAAILFVVIVAALFTGRTANTGILVVLSVIAILASIGFMVIDQAIWGIIMLLGACGIFIGKRFL